MKKQKSLIGNPVLIGLKPHKLKIIVIGVVVAFSCMSFMFYLNGPDAGYTGAPNDGSDCTGCHSDYLVNTGSGSASITSNVSAGGYIGGTTYSITATVNYVGRSLFGFQLSPQTVAGAQIGTLHTTLETQIKTDASDGFPAQYIEHVSGSTSGTNTRSWTFTWTAPAVGTGPVTFYGAFNAANSDDDVTGDYIYTKTLTIQEAGPLAAGVVTPANVSCYNSCNGSATANPSGGTPPYTYLWNTSPVQTTQTATGLCADNYSVVITDAVAATISSTTTISQPTAITITMDSTDQTSASSPNGTATAAPSGGTGAYTYAWATTPIQTTSTATGLVGATYTVVVSDVNGCTTTDTVVVKSAVGIVSLDNVNSMNAYPNPNNGNFFVDINSLNNEEYVLKVMDVAGKTVYNETLQLVKGENIRSISLAIESEGIFFVQLKSKNGAVKVIPIAKVK